MSVNGCVLDIYETTAYWWIRTIKQRLRDLDKNPSSDLKEVEFLKTFYDLTDDDYRDLYLRLSALTRKEVSDYLKTSRFSSDIFLQNTKKKGHNILNDDLENILATPVNDIKLTPKGEKNISIMTSDYNVWIGNNRGFVGLCRLFDHDYILNGDEKFKDFYYLVLSYLNQVGENVDYDILRKAFVDGYYKKNIGITKDELYFYFSYIVRVAKANKLLLEDDVCHLDICDLDRKAFAYKDEQANDIAKKLLKKNN